MFVSKRKCYSRFSHKFCGMKTLPLFQVFMLPLTGLPFHFHRSYQSFCVTTWSVTSLGVLQITFVYFWVLVLCLYTEMAENEPVSLRANLQNYLCHLWKLGAILAVLTFALMGTEQIPFVQQLQIFQFWYKTILLKNMIGKMRLGEVLL